jgi:nitronate monooxygenase
VPGLGSDPLRRGEAPRAPAGSDPLVLGRLAHPIVQAPLAGGPSTPDLTVAVAEAGALGFLAAGYRKAADVRADIRTVRGRTDAPFGVNLFALREQAVDERALGEYVAGLGPEAGEPRFEDDDWEAKLAVLHEERVPVASFTFGCPAREEIAALRQLGTEVWVTVTSPAEASAAAAAGADALVVQGVEAGGHRATWVDVDDAEALALLPLLRLAATAAPGLPLVAAGGISDGAAVAAALAAGASAAQVGTAFLRATEAGTHPAHREALAAETPTALTRAFTGRQARGLANRFMAEHPDAPVAYPQIHHATAPLRAAARERGDPEGFNLWAGQAHTLAVEAPAAEIVRILAEGAREALDAARGQTP